MPPFDDPLVVAGQGMVGMEVVRQLPSGRCSFPSAAAVSSRVSSRYIKSIRPDVKVIGVEPEGANAMLQSLFHGKICRLNKVDGFADGVAVRQVGDVCFDLCQQLVDGRRQHLARSARRSRTSSRRPDPILEPAGAVAVAGAKLYGQVHGIEGNVVAITSGANMNFDRLRVVSQLADGGLKQEATLLSIIPRAQLPAQALRRARRYRRELYRVQVQGHRVHRRRGALLRLGG